MHIRFLSVTLKGRYQCADDRINIIMNVNKTWDDVGPIGSSYRPVMALVNTGITLRVPVLRLSRRRCFKSRSSGL